MSPHSPPALNLSQHQGLFQWVCSSHQVAIVLELQLSISPSNECSGLISFRIDWFDLLSVQGTIKSPLQHCISKALSLLYGPTLMAIHDYCKNHSFDIWTFVGKVMSLLFNILSRFIIVFLPRSKYLLISWLQSPSIVILEPKKIKSATVSISSPSILPWTNGTRYHDLSFFNAEF